MAPRSEVAWEEWEEKSLLPWLDAHRALPWKAHSHAYSEQYQVDRSVESLRGKKYHILRKQRRIGARPLKHPGHPSHRSRAAAHRSAGPRSTALNQQRGKVRDQAARCHYSALYGVKKHDRRRRFGTMYIVSVQPGS
ncbi:hypothetical protein PENFLA_c099G08860 [Penicillium flavigenum]|uniref:Uncharacterized protein n=1 Tax=Penicillium flavigenum TaxID=254877 RepID=A0A1V6S7M2_9EURO|nr:hypothetical protein PENFLA_c099G08860 [Penicillium flavigenum]